jgi:hypothetical protein
MAWVAWFVIMSQKSEKQGVAGEEIAPTAGNTRLGYDLGRVHEH